MTENQHGNILLMNEAAPENGAASANPETAQTEPIVSTPAPNQHPEQGNLFPADQVDWHAEAGRKGARRVNALIQAGRLYEKEHGLKSGRQRLRQLIDLGKLYEQEHGLRPHGDKKSSERLSRMEREELLTTLVQCLLRIAKPSFRAELMRLAEALQKLPNGHAA